MNNYDKSLIIVNLVYQLKKTNGSKNYRNFLTRYQEPLDTRLVLNW